MAARTTTSCFSSLKEALLYPAQNCKILSPLLLYVVLGFYVAARFVYISPLTAEMGRHITKMELHTDPSSADCARLLDEVRHEVMVLILISIFTALVFITIASAKPIIACFATCSDDRCSLTELLPEGFKYVKGPLVVITAITMIQAASTVLGTYFDAASDTGMISVLGMLAFIFCLAIPWFCYALTVIAVASVVDDVEVVVTAPHEGCGGMRGLGESWRLIKQVRRKKGLVLVTLLLPTVLIPMYAATLLCIMEKNTGLGLRLRLLPAQSYNLLSGIIDMYYLVASIAYSAQCRNSLAMENKEAVVATDDGYAQLPSGEANI